MSDFDHFDDFISVTNIRLTSPGHPGSTAIHEIAFGQWFDLEADIEPSNAGKSDYRFTSDDIEWMITAGHLPTSNPVAEIVNDDSTPRRRRRLRILRQGQFTLRAYIRHGRAEVNNPIQD